MADQISLSLEDVNALADKLDALDDHLNADEKALLLAVFRVAGAAIEGRGDEGEVEGFAFGSPGLGMPSPVPLSQGFRNAFSPGVGGGLGGGQTIIIGGGDDPSESIGLGRGIH